ncbi:HAMP domain-containing histidine kinase [bacterium]|nr:HAMP domain-containing histidine kinase [bacterium]MBU1990858.1 HAMP domain-containing histidine kinase [bacterium]
MEDYVSKIREYLLLKVNTITIKQANFYTTLFILAFTAIFAFLLIKENYRDYERTLHHDMTTKNIEVQSADYKEKVKKTLKTLLIKNTIAIATLAFILFAIVLGLNKVFNTILQRDTQAFLDFFADAAHNEQVLNPNAIFFKDFKVMVGYANNMVETISEQKRTLQELNQGLEEKIRKKTANLQETNKNLEIEKKFSEDILNAQKEFLRYTVHETNTPLSVMLTSIELFVMKNGKDRQLSKIEAAAKNIFNIYDDLSYLVKKDQVQYPKISIELEQFLNSRIDFFSEVAQMSKVSFNYRADAKNTYVYMNETKLQRVIDNTITNAIKYTLANEPIFVTLSTNGIFIDVSVSSKSKVIKDTDKIFDAYYREEQKREGFGIGLRLVRTICDEENILISLDSDDEKTTFSYRFKMMGD